MVDVLLTHSYFLHFDPKEYKAMMPYPPLATLYAASYLREKGFSVALFDSMLAEHESDVLKAIEIYQPRIVAIYDDDFNYLTKMCLRRMRQAAFSMVALAKAAGCTVVVHGSDPVDHLDQYLAHDVDFVICGEGEQTLAETVSSLLHNNRPMESIDGLAYLHNGTIHRPNRRQVFHDLDILPPPAWDLVDIEKYRTIWANKRGYFSLNMVTTRGCPFRCNWCAKPVYGQVYHSRTPENVVKEMKFLKETLRPDHIWFCDDIFGLKPGWTAAFRDEVCRQDALIPFKCLSRVDLLLRDDAIGNLRSAGCKTVWVGAESGSQKILDAMDKGTTVEQIYEATRKLREAGIQVGFFLQYGYPGETEDDIELTFRMIKECKPDEIGVSVSYPLPGTKFYEHVKQQLGDKHNWFDSQDLDLMFPGTYSPDYYRVLHRVTHKRFRIWQGVDIMKQIATHPLDLNAQRIRRVVATAFHILTLPKLEARLKGLAKKSGPPEAEALSSLFQRT